MRQFNVLPPEVKCAHRKAVTRYAISHMRQGFFESALQQIHILAYAPWPNVSRVRRLVNVYVTYAQNKLLQPMSEARADFLRVRMRKARALSIGWMAVEGGAHGQA